MILVFKHDKGWDIRQVRTKYDALYTINHWLHTSYKTFDEMDVGTVNDDVWWFKNVKECLDCFVHCFLTIEDYDDFIEELICAL